MTHTNYLTELSMRELCSIIKPCSKLVKVSIDTKEHLDYLNKVLIELETKNIYLGETHLNSSFKTYVLRTKNDQQVLYIYEYATLYPFYEVKGDFDYTKVYYNEFGPMISAMTHCYDPENDLYLFQIRGEKMSNLGTVQISGAGFAKFGEQIPTTAVREEKEETKIISKSILPQNVFLDMTSAIIGGYLNPCFSYIAEADLSEVKNKIDTINKISKLKGMSISPETSTIFVVSLDDLPKITEDLENEEMFCGPMYKTINSFIKWYQKKKTDSIVV